MMNTEIMIMKTTNVKKKCIDMLYARTGTPAGKGNSPLLFCLTDYLQVD